MLLPQNSLLDKILSAKEYQLLDHILKESIGINAEQVKELKPVVISTQLAMIICMKAFNNTGQQLDVILQNWAKTNRMAVKGFETLLFQSQVLFGVSLEEQVAGLMREIESFNELKKFNENLCELYMKQDLKGLFHLMENNEFGGT